MTTGSAVRVFVKPVDSPALLKLLAEKQPPPA
jgi:hypothetical protein